VVGTLGVWQWAWSGLVEDASLSVVEEKERLMTDLSRAGCLWAA
jgi:hypothetical protein